MRWSSIAPLEVFSETVVHRKMFFKIGVLKIFENFTGKNLYWSHFLGNFIKNRLPNTGFFQCNLRNFCRTPIEHTVAASVFCMDFVDISYDNCHTRRLYVAAAYLCLKYNFILVCGMSFSDWWVHWLVLSTEFTVFITA